jgi:[acyl-carrier-protein] S-malonyltransferase
MRHAVSPWLADLRTAAWSAPLCPVLAGIGAEQVRGQGQKQWQKQAVQNLTQQLAAPVRWADNMDALAEAGVNVALELGPGNALARMMQARHPQIACRSLADFRTITAAVQWVLR